MGCVKGGGGGGGGVLKRVSCKKSLPVRPSKKTTWELGQSVKMQKKIRNLQEEISKVNLFYGILWEELHFERFRGRVWGPSSNGFFLSSIQSFVTRWRGKVCQAQQRARTLATGVANKKTTR